MLADFIGANEALACGYVYEVVEKSAVEGAAQALAERLIALSPVTQRAVNESVRRIVMEQRFDDDDLVSSVYGSENFRAAVAAFGSNSSKD